MSDKAIYSVDTVETITDNDKIYVNTGDNIKQIKRSDLFIDINSNLDALEYSDIAGGKNLANINDFKALTSNPSRYGYEWLNMKGGTYTFNITNGNSRLYIGYKHNEDFVNPSSVINNSIVQTITISDGDDIVIWYDEGATENTVTRLQLEVGSVATEYEPYIPSVKMLADEVGKQNESLDVIGKCKNLLNPTLQTTTLNGVTCTNNGDGTYTLNGTATENADFSFFYNLEKYQHLKNRTVKLVGCPKGGSSTTYRLMLQLQKDPWSGAYDSGEGSSITINNDDNWQCWIRIYKGATVSNLVFKPMITTDLSATYDDFVPYTGDGDTLTADVAELKNDLSGIIITDFNNAKTFGFYGFSSTTENSPRSGYAGSLLVLENSYFTNQIVFIGNDSIYMRRYDGSAWNDWKSITLS